MKIKSNLKRKLFISVTFSMVLLYAVFFMPLPFFSALWEENINFRYRMAWDISRRIKWLDQNDIILMLGEPEPHNYASSAWIYRIGPEDKPWNCLIIYFNENHIATRIYTGNPLHYLSL